MKNKDLEQAANEIFEQISAETTPEELIALIAAKAEGLAPSPPASLRTRNAVQALSPEQAEILQLVYCEGARLEDIAARLDMPLDEVRQAFITASARISLATRDNS